MSPFEKDPAVIAMRKWAALSARAYNHHQDYTDPVLRSVETASSITRLHQVYDEYLGNTFPGPFPLTPVSVTSTGPISAQIGVCAANEGFAINPATGRPAKPYRVDPGVMYMRLLDGHWLLDGSTHTTAFTCTHVKVAMIKW